MPRGPEKNFSDLFRPHVEQGLVFLDATATGLTGPHGELNSTIPVVSRVEADSNDVVHITVVTPFDIIPLLVLKRNHWSRVIGATTFAVTHV